MEAYSGKKSLYSCILATASSLCSDRHHHRRHRSEVIHGDCTGEKASEGSKNARKIKRTATLVTL